MGWQIETDECPRLTHDPMDNGDEVCCWEPVLQVARALHLPAAEHNAPYVIALLEPALA